MSDELTLPASSAPDAEAVRAQLAAILESRRFRRAGNQTALLKYLVEKALAGDSAALEAKSIGIALFGRGESFDPETDGVVTVVAERLRRTLRGYYARHGKTVSLRIELPKGDLRPVFVRVRPVPLTRRPLFWAVVLAAAALFAVLAGRFGGNLRDQTVAVAPFRNVLGDPALDSLIQRTTDHIRTGIGRSRGLRLVESGSGEPPDSRNDADAVLKASVTTHEGRIRIVLELTRGSERLWADVYDAPVSALPTVEGDIVWGIRNALGVPPE